MKSKNSNRITFVLLLLAAIAGSSLTLLVYPRIVGDANNKVTIEHVDATPGVKAFYTDPETKELVPLDFTETAKKVTPAVVYIESTFTRDRGSAGRGEQPDMEEFFRRFFGNPLGEDDGRGGQSQRPQVGVGSGVIISDDGYIVTNNHVVGDADDIEVRLNDNRTYKAKLVGTDPTTDIALIQIKETGLPHVPFYDSDDVQIGEWVLAVGNPLNLTSTVTSGIVSAKGRAIGILEEDYRIESFIQTDAVINRGNSGGALVNLQGQLVGINTAIASPSGYYTGYGFAVPSNLVSKVVEDLLEFGAVQRGVLGIQIRSLNGNVAKEMDLEITQGVLVDSVIEGSAALQAGLEKEDVITAVDGNEVSNAAELQELVGRKRPGDEVKLTVNRSGNIKEITAKLKSRSQIASAANLDEEKSEGVGILDILGADMETVSDKVAEKLGIDGGVMITRLYGGKLSGTDIKTGFIITHIDEEPVSSVEEFIEELEGKKGGVMLEGVYEDVPGVYYYAFGL